MTRESTAMESLYKRGQRHGVASYTRGEVWRRGGNAASRDGCRVKEAVREGSDDSDRMVDQKERGGRAR
jgi:hypothetical protein